MKSDAINAVFAKTKELEISRNDDSKKAYLDKFLFKLGLLC